jgi:hypothetical protein
VLGHCLVVLCPPLLRARAHNTHAANSSLPLALSQMSAEATTAPTVTDPVVEAVAVAQAEAAPAPAPVEAPAAAAVSEEAAPAPAAAEATEVAEPAKEEAKAEEPVAAEKPTNKRASFSFNKLFKSHVSRRFLARSSPACALGARDSPWQDAHPLPSDRSSPRLQTQLA